MTDMTQYSDSFQNVYEAVPEGKVFRISFDDTTRQLRVICRDHQAFDDLREAFSVKNTAAFFSERYGYKAQERLYTINKFGFFQPGMLFEVLSWIKLNYGSLSSLAMSSSCKKYIEDYLVPLKHVCTQKFEVANIADDSGRNAELQKLGKDPLKLRDYQRQAVEHLLFNGWGRGMIEVPTGAGKSFIIANFIWSILKNICSTMKSLILVPSTQLVAQFYGDLLDYGFKKEDLAKFSGSLSSKEKRENNIEDAKIVIANRQFVFKNKDALPHFDILFADEVHTCSASSTQQFICSLDSKVKVGCSGTIPRDLYQKWQLVGMFGKVLFTEEITSLQDQGFISDLDITLLKVHDRRVDRDSSLLFSLNSKVKFDAEAAALGESDVMFNDAYIAEKAYFNDHYKSLYKPVFEHLISLKTNTLMLFDRIEIGTNLYEYAKELYADKNVFYIDGSVDVHNREDIRKKFEECDGNLLIAQNAVMSTGVNIKRLTNLVFLTSSKAFARTIQSIGRTLRLHKQKDKAHIIDLSWNTKYSQKHLAERLKIYKQMYKKKPDKVIDLEV